LLWIKTGVSTIYEIISNNNGADFKLLMIKNGYHDQSYHLHRIELTATKLIKWIELRGFISKHVIKCIFVTNNSKKQAIFYQQ